jgi:hypothetical protein
MRKANNLALPTRDFFGTFSGRRSGFFFRRIVDKQGRRFSMKNYDYSGMKMP